VTEPLPQLPRLLALVPYLVQRPGVSFTEAAAEFGITEERLRKDLELVFLCGLPGHYPEDLIDIDFEGDTITVHDPQGVGRPLRLSVDEALALIVALRTLAETPGLADPDPVLRALTKVEAAAGEVASQADRFEVALEGEERVVATVREAITAGRALRMTYWSAGRDATTDRVVDPRRLVTANGRPYLEAWCRLAQDVRTFHLGRVDSLQVLEEPSNPPPNLPGRDLSLGLFQPSADDTVVELELEPSATWVAEYYPIERVTERGDGGLSVTLRAHDTSWVRRLVLSLGPAARLVAPEELVLQVQMDARSALAAYETG
jgi:proteasome accessory factor C